MGDVIIFDATNRQWWVQSDNGKFGKFHKFSTIAKAKTSATAEARRRGIRVFDKFAGRESSPRKKKRTVRRSRGMFDLGF